MLFFTFEMPYAVTTHAISVVVAPMLPEISRSDTFTTVASINSSKAHVIAVSTKITRAAPCG
jgi:hypothetical protein